MRSWYAFLIVLTAVILFLAYAGTGAIGAPIKPPPGGYPCKTLKLGVWLYGLPYVVAEAKRRGYTQAQINAARKACS